MQTTALTSHEEPLQKQGYPLKPWLVWSSSALFVLFQFFLQLSSGVMNADLMQSFALNALGAGVLSSTYYYVYVSLQTPAGVLVDHFGPRRLLTIGGVICAVGCWMFAHANQLAIAELGRVLMGGGSSFAFVGSLYLIGTWFPANRFALMVGVAETVGTIGTVFGDIFLASVVQKLGWRQSMVDATIVAALITILCWVAIRDTPRGYARPHEKPQTGFFKGTWELICNPQAWYNGLYSGALFSIVTVFVALWGIPFLMKIYGISKMLATIVGSLMFVGLAVGCPIVGWTYPRLKRRRPFLIVCALICAALLSMILYIPHLPLIIMGFLIMMSGLFCSSYVINFAIADEIAPKGAKSTSIGFTNTLSVITAPLMQPLVGWVLDLLAQRHPAISVHDIYTVADYQIALGLLPLGLIAAAFLAYLIEERPLASG